MATVAESRRKVSHLAEPLTCPSVKTWLEPAVTKPFTCRMHPCVSKQSRVTSKTLKPQQQVYSRSLRNSLGTEVRDRDEVCYKP